MLIKYIKKQFLNYVVGNIQILLILNMELDLDISLVISLVEFDLDFQLIDF